MRIVVVEDKGFYLDLLTDALRGRSIEVVGRATTPGEALNIIDNTAPDLALLDIKLSNDRDDEGLLLAESVRAAYPDVALLLLSAHLEPAYAERLLVMDAIPRAVGYVGKERLGDLDELVHAFESVVRGEVVIDPYIIGKFLARKRAASPLDRLTPHERRVLGLVAEGRSNLGIAQELGTKISTVERQVSTLTTKLGLTHVSDLERRNLNLRVLATLAFLRGTHQD